MDENMTDICLHYLNEDSADINIIIGNHTIPGHKLVLMRSSEYFKAMFSIGMIESNQNEIKLDETLVKPFELILKISYGLVISEKEWNQLSFEEIFEAIVIANKYQFLDTEIIISNKLMTKLKENSSELITEEINYKIGDDSTEKKHKFLSVIEVHEMAKSYNLMYFSNISRLYIEERAQQVMDSWRFLYNYWW